MNGQCTKTNDLLFDNGPESNERIIIFSLDEGLVHLSEADTWFCDGNFNYVPNFLCNYTLLELKSMTNLLPQYLFTSK
ncbi:unnamed protein product [Aphis gossypii]|uniref:Uncharacterized protein n=1 Tax=Aphis gossypii TaxID=80765 RepID=A0A9P0NJR8_APHGO|nr:unnamed protein product [Aphis gossypii]